MKSKDQLLLEEAYNQVNEGIWDRLKGMGSGIKAGAGTLTQNVKNKAITALGGQAPEGPQQTTGQAYAKAQQTSLLNSFIKKATKEIADFQNDIKKLGINQTDADLRAAGLTDIADKIKGVEGLLAYLQNPQAQQGQQQPQAQQGQQQPQAQQGQQKQLSQHPEAIRSRERRAKAAAAKQQPQQGQGNHPLDTNRDGTISAEENPTIGGKPAVGGTANAPGTPGQRGKSLKPSKRVAPKR
jgi:hypothetical protein